MWMVSLCDSNPGIQAKQSSSALYTQQLRLRSNHSQIHPGEGKGKTMSRENIILKHNPEATELTPAHAHVEKK